MKNNYNAKDSQVKISVCIVSYNSKDDISKCLDSLYKTSSNNNLDIDIYISDNNSPDKSADYLQQRYPNITIIKNDINGGFGYGHNKILPLVKSKYHIVLNPDITFGEDTIGKLANYLENNNDVVIVTPEIRNIDGTIQHLPKFYPKIKFILSSTIPLLNKYRIQYTMSDKDISSPTYIDTCTGCFMMIRTDIFKKVNGFDERFFMYFEDIDLSLRTKKYGRITYNPMTYVYHYWHRDSKKSKKMFMIQVKSMLRFYLKWWLRTK